MITTGQVSATTTAASLLTVPAGPCMVVLSSDPASANTAYVGPAGTVTSSNGIPVGVGQSVTFAVYGGSPAKALSVVCATGTATVGYLTSIAG